MSPHATAPPSRTATLISSSPFHAAAARHPRSLSSQTWPVTYDFDTMAPVPFFNLHASWSHYYCAVPRNGGSLAGAGLNATILSDCLIFDIVENSYLSLPPLFVWDSSAIYSSTLHKDHEDAQGQVGRAG